VDNICDATAATYDKKFYNWLNVNLQDLDGDDEVNPEKNGITFAATPLTIKENGPPMLKAARDGPTKVTIELNLADFQCRTFAQDPENMDRCALTVAPMECAVTTTCQRLNKPDVTKSVSYVKVDADENHFITVTFDDTFKDIVSCTFSAQYTESTFKNRLLRIYLKIANLLTFVFDIGAIIRRSKDNRTAGAALLMDNIDMIVTTCDD
jgi:hypothetical protein